MQENSRWHKLDTADDVAKAVKQRILAAAQLAIAEHGKFKLVLAGGSTPKKIYSLLATAQADWSNWFIYYGDERCLPENHPDRNSLMATQAFLAHVAIPANQIFTIPAELGAELGAKLYQTIVADAIPFDMVLLGMGEDGHIASLFPDRHYPVNELVHAVFDSPKPPPERISLSTCALSNTRSLLFIIIGAEKQRTVQQWRADSPLPVCMIKPELGVDIYIDHAALGSFTSDDCV
jgi:6-phosphogluconolactonase